MPKTTVTLDRERTLKFDFNALVAAEEKTGTNYLFMPKKGIGMKDVRALVWAGCLWEDPDIAIEEVGKCLDPHKNVKQAMAAVTEAFRDFFVKPDSGNGQ
jgi:hypothetical protein